jgi:hypothetical protein
MRALLVITVIALAGAAAPPAMAAKPPPEAKVIGPDESCVNIRNIRQTRVHDDKTIDFVMNGGKVYRNTLPNSCPQLGFERAFSYQTSQSQLCNVDIITVLVQAGGPRRGASCGLGKFTPIELAPKPKK